MTSILLAVYAGIAAMSFIGLIGDGSNAWTMVGVGFGIAAVQVALGSGRKRLLHALMQDLTLLSLFYRVHKGKLPPEAAGTKEFEMLKQIMDKMGSGRG